MLAFIKCALDVLIAIAAYVVYTSPTPPVVNAVQKGLSDIYVRWVFHGLKIFVCTLVLTDAVATLAVASGSPAATLNQLCPSLTRSPITVLKYPSTSFLVASAIALPSAYTRYTCYKTLGRLFTYEVSILPNHKLITSGPYAIVRHPSYVSAAIYTFALTAVFISPGTYSGECLFKQALSIFSDAIASTDNRATVGTTIGQLMSVSIVELGAMTMLVVWLTLIVVALSVAIKRLGWEERVLHEEFKGQWVAYTRAVPWKVIPGII